MLLEKEVILYDREEYEKDPLYPFYDFINALVKKLQNNKETNGSGKEDKYLPFSIKQLKYYTKSDW